MTAHMSASITLVQMVEGEKLYAWVTYGSGDKTEPQHRTELYIEAPEDVTDSRDWIRQALAALTEAV